MGQSIAQLPDEGQPLPVKVCLKLQQSCVEMQKVHAGTDYLCWYKAARRQFREVWKCDQFEDDETLILALIRFDAVISDCILSF